MTAVDERCGVLGGIILPGLCCCQWGGGSVAVCGFFVLLVCVVLENPRTGCLICRCYVSEVLTLRVSRSCVALGQNGE